MPSGPTPPENLPTPKTLTLRAGPFDLISGVLTPKEVREARAAIDRLTPLHWDHQGTTDHCKCVFNRDPFLVASLARRHN